MMNGFAKSAKDSIKETKNAFPNPGINRGKVTVQKTFQREAPISLAASSKEGSIFFKSALNSKYAVGKKVIISTMTMPGIPNKPLLVGIPKMMLVMIPLLPKRRIIAIAIKNGGEMVGSKETMRNNPEMNFDLNFT